MKVISKKKSILYLAGVLLLFLFALSALFEVRADEDPANENVGGWQLSADPELQIEETSENKEESDEESKGDPDAEPDEDVPKVLEGLCYDPADGTTLRFYVEGEVDNSFTGFAELKAPSAEEPSRWFYVEKGTVTGKKNDIISGTIESEEGWYLVRNSEFIKDTTVAENVNGWWYLENGKVDFDYSGVAKNDNGWWRIAGGKVDFNFKGFAKNEFGWWYLENGRVNFDKNDIIYGKADTDPSQAGETAWWLVRGSKVTDMDTVAQNANGWWRIADGKVDFECNSVEENEYGWWYIRGGKVDFGYTGIAQNEHGWWRIVGGHVDFSCNSVEANENGWYYIRGGKVDFDYTGIAENRNGWWRIVNGKVDFGCNSVEENEYGWWYIRGGKVDFGYTGIAQNEHGWWRIVGGQVDFGCNSVEANENGWWYLRGGKVDFSYTGIAENRNGWWRIVNGKVDFGCNSVEENEYGWWCIRGGKVDFGYYGLANNGYGWWYIHGGKVDFGYNGLAYYNGDWFYMSGGKLDWTYNGKAAPPGYPREYQVTNGRVSGWLIPPSAELAWTADAVLNSIGWNLWSAFCFSVGVTYVTDEIAPEKGIAYYANKAFSTGRGNCYAMAGVFCTLARALGYEARQLAGDVGAYPHSWCEVFVDGNWYVFDISFANANLGNGYMFTYGTKGTWIYSNNYYYMTN